MGICNYLKKKRLIKIKILSVVWTEYPGMVAEFHLKKNCSIVLLFGKMLRSTGSSFPHTPSIPPSKPPATCPHSISAEVIPGKWEKAFRAPIAITNEGSLVSYKCFSGPGLGNGDRNGVSPRSTRSPCCLEHMPLHLGHASETPAHGWEKFTLKGAQTFCWELWAVCLSFLLGIHLLKVLDIWSDL